MPDTTATTATVPATVPASPAVVTEKPNPFRAVALLLKSVNDSLENAKTPTSAPRWVRLVRVRQFLPPQQAQADTIAKAVKAATDGLLTGIGYIQKFTLSGRDVLIQGDSAKALFEVSGQLIKTISSAEFVNSLTAVVDGPTFESSPMQSVGGVIDTISDIVDRVPEPEDLDVIEAELYRMLVIEQLGADAKDAQIDIAKTGKLRLIQWGLSTSFGPTTTLGVRRLVEGDATALPQASSASWFDANNPAEKVFEFSFVNGGLKDVNELKALLKSLGYYAAQPAADSPFDAELTTALKNFQTLNEIKVTGLLDNLTLNRLLNLSYDPDPAKGKLKRAKPFDATKLPAKKG